MTRFEAMRRRVGLTGSVSEWWIFDHAQDTWHNGPYDGEYWAEREVDRLNATVKASDGRPDPISNARG